ncbi:MAG: aminodeoxychorismate/anthranilate synthase component II [Lentimicrobium sp.]|nr:aminodeoxychorismate/anthranilate synthase component II [Lentimicrobium sp.]
MRILLLDNYDSFTFNLLQLLCEAGADKVDVISNDNITISEAAKYDAIVISPGPGLPKDAGITCQLIQNLGSSHKILGVCLGMQAIATVYGGSLIQPGQILHGVATKIFPEKPADTIFKGLDSGFEAGLYHSWAVDAHGIPPELEITAFDSRKVLMALRHRHYNVRGVQFHPESVMTNQGRQIIENWLSENF